MSGKLILHKNEQWKSNQGQGQIPCEVIIITNWKEQKSIPRGNKGSKTDIPTKQGKRCNHFKRRLKTRRNH